MLPKNNLLVYTILNQAYQLGPTSQTSQTFPGPKPQALKFHSGSERLAVVALMQGPGFRVLGRITILVGLY